MELQSWPKCVGHCLHAPLYAMLDVNSASDFQTNNIVWELGVGRSRLAEGTVFIFENPYDGRGTAICKGVPHNLGQDCSLEMYERVFCLE